MAEPRPATAVACMFISGIACTLITSDVIFGIGCGIMSGLMSLALDIVDPFKLFDKKDGE